MATAELTAILDLHDLSVAANPRPLDQGRDEAPAGIARRLARALFERAPRSDAAAAFDEGALDALHRSTLLMAPFPDELGGDDLAAPRRAEALYDVLRIIGWGDLSVGRLFEGHVNAVALLCRYGTPGQRRRAAEDTRAGGLMGVWGADDALGLSMEREGAAWRLSGRKVLASGAGLVTNPLVTAGSGAGQIMLLPGKPSRDRADVTGWTAQGMRATATGAVDFSGMSLREDQILGRPGDFMRQPHFSGGAWRFCAVHLGAVERLLDLFRAHLLARKRDADPYQLQRVAQGVAAAGSAAFWIRSAALRLGQGSEDPETLVALVNMTRMVTERAALDVLETVQRGVGLHAFLRPHPIERVARDLSTYLRQPVPDLAMADAARAVLASPRDTGDLWRHDLEG